MRCGGLLSGGRIDRGGTRLKPMQAAAEQHPEHDQDQDDAKET